MHKERARKSHAPAWLLSVVLLPVMLASLHAQEHLVPEAGEIAEHDEYHFKVREFFAAAKPGEVLCQVIILGGWEQLVGVRKTATGHEVFSIVPDSYIWHTEVIRMYEAGKTISYGKDGRKLTLEEDESYQYLKKTTPADFRKIPTIVKAVAIDEPLAHRIVAIWERMLMATRQPKEPNGGLDGGSYHFSMFILGRGIISGQVWSPDPKTKTAALTELAERMSEHARGHLDAEELKKTVSRVEKLTRP